MHRAAPVSVDFQREVTKGLDRDVDLEVLEKVPVMTLSHSVVKYWYSLRRMVKREVWQTLDYQIPML